MEMCQTRDIIDQQTDIFEVGWTSAADAVKGSDDPLTQYLLMYWQPTKHITKNWQDVLQSMHHLQNVPYY